MFGQAYRLMLNYPKSKEYLEEALRLKPDFCPAQLMLADTLLAMDQPKEARTILQKLPASGYEPGQTAYLMGVAATKEGQYSEALEYFRKAESEPKVAQEAKFQASLALAALNRTREAKKSMRRALPLTPRARPRILPNAIWGPYPSGRKNCVPSTSPSPKGLNTTPT